MAREPAAKLPMPERALKGALTTLPVWRAPRTAGFRSGPERVNPFAEPMPQQLPPPDPNESLGHVPARDASLPWPTAVYLGGPPALEHERVADALLDLRPGLLVVCAGDR